ncbi:hypothetical protein ACISU4_28615 [Streptomyces wuyuanensis]|uniref:hypothetical protein n=1 Tax=Streptomyces wuyuanensis TaxID=1196353 RepID=UPI00382B80EC
MTRRTHVAVAGGGRSGLAADHHPRRVGIDFAVLDRDPRPGDAPAIAPVTVRPVHQALTPWRS